MKITMRFLAGSLALAAMMLFLSAGNVFADKALKKDAPVAEAKGKGIETADVQAEDVQKEEAKTRCHLSFDLKSWSVFYKRGTGNGVINCENGQKANVAISAHGGGVTFGKSEIQNGRGSFSKVQDINELFGGYATSEAHAGVYGSAAAQAMTKGKISLALSGTGKGYDLGFAFGKFKITPTDARIEKVKESDVGKK